MCFHLDQEGLCTGVLYFGDIAANNVKASDYVREVTSRAQLESWLSDSADAQLHVLDVSLTSATPCVHIFPAVLALAKNMAGSASFARLMADKGSEAQSLAKEYKVVQVSTHGSQARTNGLSWVRVH